MKKNCLALVILFAAAMSAAASPQATELAFPWEVSNPDGNIGNGAIISGFFLDCIGVGLFAGSSAAVSLDLGVGMGLYFGGCLSMGTGAFLMNIGTENRHKGLEAKGYSIQTTRHGLSNTLSWITVGCEVGAMGVGFSIGDSTGGIITSIIIGGAGAIVEVFNMYLTRRNWLTDINTSISGKSAGKKKGKSGETVDDGPTLMPLFGAGWDAEANRATALMGFSLGL